MGELEGKLDDIMKKTKTIRSQLMGVLIDTVIVSMVLVITTLVVYRHVEKEYEQSTEQILLLNSYYNALEDINGEVYTYTLEGNEDVYKQIAEKCSSNQRKLKQLADIHAGKQFYRDVRDVEQMFLLYIQRIKKIYDHSYLCEEMTIGSKAIINKYYNKTQEVYKAMDAQFQNLSSKLAKSNSTIRFATMSASFGNWQKTYGFEVYPVVMSKFGALPNETQLQAIKDRLKEDNVQYLVYEPNMTEDLITLYDSILEELGMTRIQLSNLSSETDQEEADGKDYLSIMYENLSVLSTLSSVSISPEIQ